MYSTIGSMLANAFIKLDPIHRRLTELEVSNIRDFFNSDFISPERRRQLDRLTAFLMTYMNAIRRTAQLSKKARQDYYALQRQGCFVTKELPAPVSAMSHSSPYPPILIVPGLNTPPVFFREMHSYFSGKGYLVSVMDLPANGMADIASCAEALREQVERIKTQYGASQVNIIGHCLGGLIAHYWLECLDTARQAPPVSNLISLGTGFMGAEGVQQLKNLWIPRNPGKPVPKVFDELIQANMNIVRRSSQVARHNLITIWDFMVHFRKALLESPYGQAAQVFNHIIDDPAIDHLTLALNHTVFQRMEAILASHAPIIAPESSILHSAEALLTPSGTR
jgi:pimeloyl-ACP methyl ester carboxylesterase